MLVIVSLPIAWPWWIIHACLNVPLFTITKQNSISTDKVGISGLMYHKDGNGGLVLFGLILLCPFLTLVASAVLFSVAYAYASVESLESFLGVFDADTSVSLALVICLSANALFWLCGMCVVLLLMSRDGECDGCCEKMVTIATCIVCSPFWIACGNCFALCEVTFVCRVLDMAVLFLIGSDQVLLGKLSLTSWHEGEEYDKFAKGLRHYEHVRREALNAVLVDENVVCMVLSYLHHLEMNGEGVARDSDVVASVYSLQMTMVRDYARDHESLERLFVLSPSETLAASDYESTLAA